MATWEHIVNDARIVNRENIARCCSACNSSKGIKKLSDWLESAYCGRRGITRDTVAEVVKVFCAVGEDPVQNGMVSSVARPGGNATGTVTLAVELEAKRLELLNEAVLGLARAAVLWNPPSLSHRIAMPDVEAAARRLSIRFLIRGARDRHARAPRAAGSRRAWSGSRLLRDRSRHEC
jgi:hypothetical protein